MLLLLQKQSKHQGLMPVRSNNQFETLTMLVTLLYAL